MTDVTNGKTTLIFRYDHIVPLVNVKCSLKCSLLCESYLVQPISDLFHFPTSLPKSLYLALLFLFPIILTTFWHTVQLTYWLYAFFVCLPASMKAAKGQKCLLYSPVLNAKLSIIHFCMNQWIKSNNTRVIHKAYENQKEIQDANEARGYGSKFHPL